MAVDPIPFIDPDDYQTMRVLAIDLPFEYEEWHSDFYEREMDERRKLGHDPQPVPITPVVFNGYLTRTQREGSTHELLRCAIALAKAKPPHAPDDNEPLDTARG